MLMNFEAIHRLTLGDCLIDLSPVPLALAPTFREDFRESPYRIVALPPRDGITMIITA